MAEPSWRDGKRGATARGYDYAWQRYRLSFLEANPLCVLCRRDDRPLTPATIVDHIEPHRGDSAKFWDPANHQAVCKPCHDTVKAAEEGRSRNVGCDVDGWPLARSHHWNRG